MFVSSLVLYISTQVTSLNQISSREIHSSILPEFGHLNTGTSSQSNVFFIAYLKT